MSEAPEYGPDNPHPLSELKTELVWEGKYDDYGNRREVDVAGADLPLQKIESIDEPRSSAEGKGQLALFEKRSKRQDDFRNMLIWGDNKLVMASLLRDFRGKIDLIYIDPPFDVGADFTMNIPIGKKKESTAKDQSILEMVAYRDMWGKGIDSYIHTMYESLVFMRDLLSGSGSIYVHLDFRVAHLVKVALDEVFGLHNLCNDISWCYRGYEHNRSYWNRKHDSILYYAKSIENLYFDPESVREQLSEVTKHKYKYVDEKGPYRIRGRNIKGSPVKQQTDLSHADEEKYRGLTYRQYMTEGTLPRDWFVLDYVNQAANEKVDFPTQKPEALLEKLLLASSRPGALVADFFCGSGTTGAVSEKLDRPWIMCDLGRFAIHTSRKRMIEIQRQLYSEQKPYRAFDVYNLGRYERQWWQKERLQGADEEHREIVLAFYRAEPLTGASSPLLHGRKGPAYVHVDGIDSILTLEELNPIVEATHAAGAKEVHCLAWEFEMDLKRNAEAVEHEYGVKVRLTRIPREVMEKNRRPGVDEVPFFEMATLQAEPVVRVEGGVRIADVKLTNFLPSLSEVPSKELEALKERAVKSGFDFIDFWAVDFDHTNGEPFNHHWQDYRLRKDRTLKIVSDCVHTYQDTDPHTICVKVIDVFGCDTSTLLQVPGAARGKRAKR